MSRAKTVTIERDSDNEGDVRKLIIQSAVKLFDKYGYSNVKISDITSNIGLTTGAFYYYFQGKEEVLETVSNFYIDIAARKAEEIYNWTDIGTEEKLFTLLRAHCMGIAAYHSHVSVFFREYRNLNPDGLVKAIESNRQLLHYTTSLIKQGSEEGSFRADLHPKVTALAIIGMCNWLYQWFSPAGEMTIEEISDLFASLVRGGLETTPSAKKAPRPKRP